MTNYNAKYRNVCRIKFKYTKLERAQKRHMSPQTSVSSSECKFPKPFRCTPCSKNKQPYPIENVHNCFICDKESLLSVLREEITIKLNQRIVDYATFFRNKQLWAKLICGDFIAQEIKYHQTCLAAVEREIKEESEESVVFRLSDLANLYLVLILHMYILLARRINFCRK